MCHRDPMRRKHRVHGGVGWTIAAWLAGCGPVVLPEGDTETEAVSEESSSTGEPPSTTTAQPPPPGTTTAPPPPPDPTTTTSPPSDESTTGEAQTSVGFLDDNDASNGNECDLFLQDCPRGEKCMPWANDGSSWNDLRCSPIAEDPDAVGEPCTVEGSAVSGIDSCAAASMCFYVDPETNAGTCVAFCVGSADNPMCDPGFWCAMNGDGALALCIADCDPLLQDCAEGQACHHVNGNFACVPDDSGDMGLPGDPCEFVNACDPGTFCAEEGLVPGCEGAIGCCTPFCDTTSNDPWYCLPGQECMPWYEEGAAPPGYEHVGGCVLPM